MSDYPMLDGLDAFARLDTESERVAAFFEAGPDWSRPTRCEGWTVRDMLGHLAGVEVYHTACLDDGLASLTAEGAEHGATDLDSFNDWLIRERADKSADEVLAEWRASNRSVRDRMRERGVDATMASSVGPYPVGLMAFHVASEYATHADDVDIEIPDREAGDRLAWRVGVSLFALAEKQSPVEVTRTEDGVRVRADGVEAAISESDLVEAVAARLPDDHPLDPALQSALRALA